jgi:hypothetical protein
LTACSFAQPQFRWFGEMGSPTESTHFRARDLRTRGLDSKRPHSVKCAPSRTDHACALCPRGAACLSLAMIGMNGNGDVVARDSATSTSASTQFTTPLAPRRTAKASACISMVSASCAYQLLPALRLSLSNQTLSPTSLAAGQSSMRFLSARTGAVRTGIVTALKQSPSCRNGNWKIASRDWRRLS